MSATLLAKKIQKQEIFLIRHGATKWSKSGAHTGRTDLELLEEGKDQARNLEPFLNGLKFSYILSSPLKRAFDTAKLAGLTPIEIEDDLIEWDYGSMEGLTTAQIRESIPNWTIFKDGVLGGESIDDVARRARNVIDKVTSLGGERVALVAHGHILRVLATQWILAPPTYGANLMLSPASISILSFEHETPGISRWNWRPELNQ